MNVYLNKVYMCINFIYVWVNKVDVRLYYR